MCVFVGEIKEEGFEPYAMVHFHRRLWHLNQRPQQPIPSNIRLDCPALSASKTIRFLARE
jgi:hypothetical protein